FLRPPAVLLSASRCLPRAAFQRLEVSVKSAPARLPSTSDSSPGSKWDAVSSFPALFLSGFGFCGRGRMRLPDRLLDIDQRRGRAARIGPDEIADQNEI